MRLDTAVRGAGLLILTTQRMGVGVAVVLAGLTSGLACAPGVPTRAMAPNNDAQPFKYNFTSFP